LGGKYSVFKVLVERGRLQTLRLVDANVSDRLSEEFSNPTQRRLLLNFVGLRLRFAQQSKVTPGTLI
jgi:hypothetical protein